ncbi:MAG TPA: hypothetical protein VJ647_02070 [Chitinophagaceae bacterium]|nr:hypothetical protein [Chitinophagaceae bacterium]
MPERSDILNKLKESSRELYSVPDGYFESFPQQMLEKAKATPPARVISLGKRIFRYTAAAVVAGFIGFGAWLWINKPATVDNYAALPADKDVLQEIQAISDSEMTAYMENSALTATNDKALASTDMINLKSEVAGLMLADIPDEALQQYLEQNNSSKPLIN